MPRSITDIATRHQVMLERLKASKAKDYLQIAKQFEADIIAKANNLGVQSMNELTKKDLNALIVSLTETNKKYQQAIVTDLQSDLEKLAQNDAIFEQESINRFLKNKVATSAADVAYSKALLAPISASGELLDPFIKNWSQTRINQVNGAIRKGYQEGLTLQQMTQRIRGTKANNYKDGLTNLQKRQAEAVIRTSVQHVSSTARMATLERNKDIVIAYKWRSTLDGRTTQRCRSLDGLEFEMGRGPMPPIHIGCRSTFNYVLDPKLGLDELDEGATRASKTGAVPANETYYDWLKKQPKSFQEEAIGKQRTAWLNDGKLTAEEFARLNLDKNFRPLTLQEMKEKRSVIISGKTGTTATKAATAITKTSSLTDSAIILRESSTIMKGKKVDFNEAAIKNASANVSKQEKLLKNLDQAYQEADLKALRDPAFIAQRNALKRQFLEEYKTYENLEKARDLEIRKVTAQTQKTDKELKAVIFKKRHEEKLNQLGVLGTGKKGALTVTQKERVVEAKKLLESALSADNLKSINKNGKLTKVIFTKKRTINGQPFRAHYVNTQNAVFARSGENVSTLLHEFMHSLEYANPEVSKKTKAFLVKRSGGAAPKKLSDLTGNSGYKAGEIAVEDKWVEKGGSAYMGKIYDRASTELLTMGVERLLKSPTEFFLRDREYFDFVIETLNLTL